MIRFALAIAIIVIIIRIFDGGLTLNLNGEKYKLEIEDNTKSSKVK